MKKLLIAVSLTLFCSLSPYQANKANLSIRDAKDFSR